MWNYSKKAKLCHAEKTETKIQYFLMKCDNL